MNITSLLSAKAREIPDAPAILTAEATLSYGELDRAVSWTAGAYRKAGLLPGDMVGILLANQARHLVTSLALARLGAGQITFDASDPPGLCLELAKRLNLTVTIADRSTKIHTESPRIDPPDAGLADFKRLKPVIFEGPDDAALPFLIQRSSGTTGIPKLGVLSHAAAIARAEAHAHALPDGPGSIYLSLSPVGFDGAKQRVYRTVTSGGCVAFHEGSSVQSFVEFINGHFVNFVSGVPNQVAELIKLAGTNENLFPGLQAFRVGATIVPEVLRKEIQERLTPNLYVGYASNEAGAITIAPPAMVRSIPGVVGNVVPNMKLDIVNDDGQPLSSGKVGRVRLKSPGLMSGYINDPAETARAFRDGWFYTSDLAEFTPEGALIHHGRADDVMILNGINIYPSEIENTLLEHEAVAEAAAFPLDTVAHGGVPIAAIVTKSAVSENELFAYCRSILGAHAPHGLMFVSKLPRNAMGKVLKNELSRLFLQERAKRQSDNQQ